MSVIAINMNSIIIHIIVIYRIKICGLLTYERYVVLEKGDEAAEQPLMLLLPPPPPPPLFSIFIFLVSDLTPIGAKE